MSKFIKSLLVLLVALIAVPANAVQALAADVPAGLRLIGASSWGGKAVSLEFNIPLTDAEGETAVVPLDASDFSVRGAEGISIERAEAIGYYVNLFLNKAPAGTSSITVDIAAGAVTAAAGGANAAVEGYKVQTIEGMIGILEAMNATSTNPTVSHVVKYLKNPGAADVAGGAGLNREDARFLLSFIGAEESLYEMLSDVAGYARDLMLREGYGRVPETDRLNLLGAVEAAEGALSGTDKILYKIGAAWLDLSNAYYSVLSLLEQPPAGLTAAIGGFGYDGYLYSFDVMFSGDVSEATRALTAAELLQGVTFQGESDFTWQLDRLEIYWTDAQTLNINFNGGVSDMWDGIIVDFLDGKVAGANNEPLLIDPVQYRKPAPLSAFIENTVYDGDSLTAFDIRFSAELSEETLGLAAAGDIFWDIELNSGEASDYADLSAVNVQWVGSNILRVSVPAGLGSSWNVLIVRFMEDSIIGADGEMMDYPMVPYFELPYAGALEVSDAYQEVYAPYGMTVAKLLEGLNSEYPNAELIGGNESIPDEYEEVRGGMAVNLDGAAAVYSILTSGVASSAADIQDWLDQTDVSVIKVDPGFSESIDTLYLSRPIRLRADAPVEISIDGLAYGYEVGPNDLMPDEEVSLTVGVDNDFEIISLADSYNITRLELKSGFGGYAGVYTRNTAMEQYHYANGSGAAVVFNADSLLDAFEDSSITRIYLANNIDMPSGYALEIPSWVTEISGSAARTLSASSIVLPEGLTLNQVEWIETFEGVPLSVKIRPPFDVMSVDFIDLEFNQPVAPEVIGTDVVSSVVLTYASGSGTIVDPIDIPLSAHWWNATGDVLQLDWPDYYPMDGLEYITVNFVPGTVKGIGGDPLTQDSVTLNLIPIEASIGNVAAEAGLMTGFDVTFTAAVGEGTVDAGQAAVTSVFADYGGSYQILNSGNYSVSWSADRRVMTVAIPGGVLLTGLGFFEVSLDRNVIQSADGRYIGDYSPDYAFVS
ncbi:hypothetical protein [uncultured Paenibacillus sp.]|uniref:hypothetical protein n=2 Tax=Paenibacillus TaxID=44249 RepID=UPI0028D39A9C|nr:hypothetical protein [uncultured Paenibacillus sp.]